MALIYIREVVTAVNALIVRSAGTAIIQRRDPGLLASAGGSVVLTKDWARYVLQWMGYVKRKATPKQKLLWKTFTR